MFAVTGIAGKVGGRGGPQRTFLRLACPSGDQRSQQECPWARLGCDTDIADDRYRRTHSGIRAAGGHSAGMRISRPVAFLQTLSPRCPHETRALASHIDE